MEAAKHTPGPWHHSGGFDNYEGVFAQSGLVASLDGNARRFANARLIAAAPDLLDELEKAHRIIRNALAVMNAEQKLQWGELNEAAGVAGEGVTRANEREAVINKALGK